MTENDLPTVTVEEVPAPGDQAVLLDVREDDEWAAGHAPGAVHIPLGELPARAGELNRELPIYVVCRSGKRSERATAWLVQNGVQAHNVAGGMTQYAASGREIVSDAGDATII